MPDEFSGYQEQETAQKQTETAATVPESPIRRLKQEHPEYQQLTDADLADRLYKKHYQGKIPEDEYYQRVGVEAPSALKEIAPAAGYGLREGLISDVLGMPGGIERLIDAGITSADAFIRRKFGMDPVDYEKRRNELPEWAKTHLPTPQDIDQAFGWEDYNPRTKTGKYVKSVAEMLPAFIAPEEAAAARLTGAGKGIVKSEFKAAGTKAAVPAKRGVELLTEGLPARGAAAVASGVGSEAAGELTDDNALARAIGGGIGGLAVGAANVERTAIANRTRLKDAKAAAQQGYDFLANSTHPIGPLDMKGLGDTTEINLQQMGYRQITAPRTWNIIDKELKAPPGGVTQVYQGGLVTTQYPGQLVRRVQDLVATHEALGKIKPSAESMTDFEAAQEARAGIRNFLQSLPDKSISKTHKNATANWAQYAKERDLREAVETAENRAASTGRGNNYQNTIRQEVRKILEERISRGGLLAGEEQAMRAITRGTTFENIVRVMSSFAPWDLHRGTAVALIGGFTGGWPAALAVGGAGAAMQVLGKALNKRDMRKLLDRIQENAPVNYRITPANRRAIQRARNLRQFAGARGAAIGTEQGEQARAPPRPHEQSALVDHDGDLGSFASRFNPIGSAQAGEFKPIDPMNPSYTNPGGHEKLPPVENPARASRADQVRSGLATGKTFAQLARELGTTRNAIAGLASRAGLKTSRTAKHTEEGLAALRESGKATGGLASHPSGWTRGTRPIPQIRVQALPPSVREQILREQRYGTGRPTPSLPQFNLPPLPEEESMLTPEGVLENPETA